MVGVQHLANRERSQGAFVLVMGQDLHCTAKNSGSEMLTYLQANRLVQHSFILKEDRRPSGQRKWVSTQQQWQPLD